MVLKPWEQALLTHLFMARDEDGMRAWLNTLMTLDENELKDNIIIYLVNEIKEMKGLS